jgi:hypothetical protein
MSVHVDVLYRRSWWEMVSVGARQTIERLVSSRLQVFQRMDGSLPVDGGGGDGGMGMK